MILEVRYLILNYSVIIYIGRLYLAYPIGFKVYFLFFSTNILKPKQSVDTLSILVRVVS